MSEKIPNQEITTQATPLIEANPELDKLIDEINDLIAIMIACHGDLNVPACRMAQEKKNKLQEKNSDILLPYLKPYFDLNWESDAQASTIIEWARYRVAHNWNK